MTYIEPKKAQIVYYNNNFVPGPTWACTSNDAGANTLVGIWNCGNFYSGNPITITSDFQNDFISQRDNDHVEICESNFLFFLHHSFNQENYEEVYMNKQNVSNFTCN